eukprot:c11770_g8_i2.p1 GENE.c11770_g8_i2~~c11770_g8_i2.p1  ORF type:complete len:572 (-),score=132.08 c11770_g8_i2:88-1803(-)
MRDSRNSAEIVWLSLPGICDAIQQQQHDATRLLDLVLSQQQQFSNSNTSQSLREDDSNALTVCVQNVLDALCTPDTNAHCLQLAINDLYRNFHMVKGTNNLLDRAQFVRLGKFYGVTFDTHDCNTVFAQNPFCGFQSFVEFAFGHPNLEFSSNCKRNVLNLNSLASAFRSGMNKQHKIPPSCLRWIGRIYELDHVGLQKLLESSAPVSFQEFVSTFIPDSSFKNLNIGQLFLDFVEMDVHTSGFVSIDDMCGVHGVFPESFRLHVMSKGCQTDDLCFLEYVNLWSRLRLEALSRHTLNSLPHIHAVTLRSYPQISLAHLRATFDAHLRESSNPSISNPLQAIPIERACLAVSSLILSGPKRIDATLIADWSAGKVVVASRFAATQVPGKSSGKQLTFVDVVKLCLNTGELFEGSEGTVDELLTQVKQLHDACVVASTDKCHQQHNGEIKVAVLMEYLEYLELVDKPDASVETESSFRDSCRQILADAIEPRDPMCPVTFEKLLAWIQENANETEFDKQLQTINDGKSRRYHQQLLDHSQKDLFDLACQEIAELQQSKQLLLDLCNVCCLLL